MESMLMDGLYDYPVNISKGKLTPFPQAMPDQYKDSNAVIAYRQYYIGEKTRFAKWKMDNQPEWFMKKEPLYIEEEVPF